MKPFVIAACLAAWCLPTCAPIPLGDGDRRIVARELGTDVVVPTLDQVKARTGELTRAVRRLATLQDLTSLHDAQFRWRAARVPWKRADAFGFGPAADLRLTAAMDQVIDPSKIDAVIAGTSEISESTVDALGANAKGFHALESLLFGADDAVVLGLLTFDPGGPRRRALAVAYAENLEARADELRAAWTGEQDLIAHPGSANPTYPTVADSIDAFVNESVFLAETAADARLGKPSGTATGGVPQPDLQESGPSDNSLADLSDSLRGIRNIYFGSLDGSPGKGIGKLIADQAPATDLAMRTALATALDAVAAIPRPFAVALAEQRPEIAIALDAVKELKVVLATEVVGVLGATLKFNDNDGD